MSCVLDEFSNYLSILNGHEKETQLTVFLVISHMKPWAVLYFYIGMLDCIPATRYQYICDYYATSGQFTASIIEDTDI